MKIRILSLIIILLVLLSACNKTSNLIEEPSQNTVDWMSFQQGRSVKIPLSFRNRTGERLTTEIRDVTIRAGMTIEEAAVEELIAGPESGDNLPVMPDCLLERVEVINNITNIFITMDDVPFPIEILTARAALSNTLAAVSNAEYVNIYVNNVEVGYNMLPLGPIKKQNIELAEYVDQIRENAMLFADDEPADLRSNVVLYFSDTSEKYLLAEVRDLSFKSSSVSDIASEIISRVVDGPHDKGSMKNVIDSGSFDYSIATFSNSSGRYVVRISLESEPQNAEMAFGSITYSLIGFIPQLERVEFFVAANPVETLPRAEVFTDDGREFYMTFESFANLIGSTETIYLPRDRFALEPKTVTLYNKHTKSPRFLLETILSQNIGIRDGIFGHGISSEDIIDAIVSGDLVIINFKDSILEKCKGMHEADEFIFVYSIVDTMAQIPGIKQVQILVDNQAIDSLAGKIHIMNPLLPNLGIIDK